MVSITKQDIESALDRIDKQGIPSRNRSKGYCLKSAKRGKRHYPPKHVLRLAYESKRERMPYRGGPPVNNRLEALEYTIEPCDCRNVELMVTD